MTERFKLVRNWKNYLRVDDKTKKLFYLNENDVVEALNELHNGVVELNEICEYYEGRIDELEKENEQLKTQLQQLKEDAPLLLAFYRWYPYAVEKKEHQAYNRLWNFVND